MMHRLTTDQAVLIAICALAAVVVGGRVGYSQRGAVGSVSAMIVAVMIVALVSALFWIRV